ncbi:MAG: putative DNA binding domain-containing protein [Acidimicrobiia bacterium]|nr:putative DNA binding domain-containing protein [Acidimicrobiia bacterium]
MDAREVKRLAASGEQFTVELKGETSAALSDGELVHAVVCLANAEGGTILVGIEDDGEITGARRRHGERTDPSRLAALIAARTQPPVRTEVTVVDVDDVDVVAVTVPAGGRLVGTTDGKYVRRAIGSDGRPECAPMHSAELLAAEIDRGARDFAALDVPEAEFTDLDPLEFDRIRRLVRETEGRGDPSLLELSDFDIAVALGCVSGTRRDPAIRAGALLLFGSEAALAKHIPTHEVAFQALRPDLTAEVNDFFCWPLLRVADELLSRFRARNTQDELQVGLLRVAVPAYPEASLREATMNALVHRDFTKLGSVHVQWYADRVEISNPGGFMPGLDPGNLLVAPPTPRNPLLADAFKRAGLVERTGRGVNLIFGGQARYGRALPDYHRSTREHVTVVIPGGPANLALVRFLTEESEAGRQMGFEQLLVLNELAHERRITTAEAATLLQEDTGSVRGVLNRMVDAGLLEARGERKGRVWMLAPALYEAIGEGSGYVRGRGFDAIQQEQMILQYVEAYGSITRGQAAELCRVKPEQARRVLKRLTERGDLGLVGEKRGARYERSPKL